MARRSQVVGIVLAVVAFLALVNVGCHPADALPTAAGPAATAITTPAEAAAQAAAFSGFPETAITSVEQRTVSDPVSPVWEVKDMLVWEVVFDGISFTVPQSEGEAATGPAVEASTDQTASGEAQPAAGPLSNANLHSLTVWLDPETGAPVRMATPHPKEGGLTLMVSGRTGRLSGVENLHLEMKMSAVPPEKPLSVVTVARREQQECTLAATEMVAYYGLLTHRLGAETVIADKPFWLVYYAGLAGARIRRFSGGPAALDASSTSRPTVYASEVLLVMDATSGKREFSTAVGRPD